MSVVLRVGPMGPVYNRPPKLRPGTRVVKAVAAPPAAQETIIEQIAKPAVASTAVQPKPAPVVEPQVKPDDK